LRKTMNGRSTAAIAVAVMCAAALGEAHAQRLEPHAVADLIALIGGDARCTERIVFEHALRGMPLCSDLASSRPTAVDYTTLFLDATELHAKRRVSEVAREREVERGDFKESRTETAPIEPRTETPRDEARIERPEEVYDAVVTATPEPATLALVASGMAGLAAYRRRRTKKSEGINK
jgi:hypothetical protein